MIVNKAIKAKRPLNEADGIDYSNAIEVDGEAIDAGSDADASATAEVANPGPGDIDYDNAIDQGGKKVRKAGRREYDYADSFSKAGSASQQEAVVSRFIRDWSKAAGIDSKVKKIATPLKDEIMSLREAGFDENRNHVLPFLRAYLPSADNMGPDQFIVLSNMWSSGTIGKKELTATSPQQCILLNKNLWDMPLNDIGFIVQTYLWIMQRGTLERYIDFKALRDNVLAAMRDAKLKSREAKESAVFGGNTLPALYTPYVNFVLSEPDELSSIEARKKLRDTIVFEDNGDVAGKIHSADQIEGMLAVIEDTFPKPEGNAAFEDEASAQRTTIPEVDAMFKSGKMGRDDFLKIYKAAEMQGWTR